MLLLEGRWNGYEVNKKNLPGSNPVRILRSLFRPVGTPSANSTGEQRLLQRQLPQLLHTRFLHCQVAALVAARSGGAGGRVGLCVGRAISWEAVADLPSAGRWPRHSSPMCARWGSRFQRVSAAFTSSQRQQAVGLMGGILDVRLNVCARADTAQVLAAYPADGSSPTDITCKDLS